LPAARLSNLLLRDEMDTGASSSSPFGDELGDRELMVDGEKRNGLLKFASHRLVVAVPVEAYR